MCSLWPTLVGAPAVIAIVVAAHFLVALAHEARLFAVTLIALRGTQPDQRSAILRALSTDSRCQERWVIAQTTVKGE
jgi:hypothetical protein